MSKKDKIIDGDYMITIKGTQMVDLQVDTVELNTVGHYSNDGGHSRITYEESETTGFPGCSTTIEIDRNNCVSVLRRGTTNSHIVIDRKQRHLCHYETIYGNIMIGVSCTLIDNQLKEDGGSLSFAYKLDVNSNHFSANRMDITVRHHEKPETNNVLN